MNQESPSILDPIREVKTTYETVSIRELSWPKALKFLTNLSKHAGQFIDEKGAVKFKLENLTDMIAQAGELSTYLILNSTDKDQTWLDALSFADGCDVLDAALSVNLTPEILGKAKKASGRFALALGIKAAAPKTNHSAPV